MCQRKQTAQEETSQKGDQDLYKSWHLLLAFGSYDQYITEYIRPFWRLLRIQDGLYVMQTCNWMKQEDTPYWDTRKQASDILVQLVRGSYMKFL